jgi:hypothetical protein
MAQRGKSRILDSLYGDVVFGEHIANLLDVPALQRLRDIRLSNIDSLSMPGIANISRYEHALGCAYLASQVGFSHRLTWQDSTVLQAAALLHDTAITPFGHLVEEALQYVGVDFDHEKTWDLVLSGETSGNLGGIDLQVCRGKETGLSRWAERTFGNDAKERLASILGTLRGNGVFGPCIAGDIDLDNLDNLTRIAYHMGLDVDRGLPVRVARAMLDTRNCEYAVFSSSSLPDIQSWLELRHRVYQRLMLAKEDFIGKTMIIHSVVEAYRGKYLGPPEFAWRLTDRELIHALLTCKDRTVSGTIVKWLDGNLWPLSDLLWMEGEAPSYPQVFDFCAAVTKELSRPCFAYRIKDKRFRMLTVQLDSQGTRKLGIEPKQWLLGVTSSLQRDFTERENKSLTRFAAEFFKKTCLGRADASSREVSNLFS